MTLVPIPRRRPTRDDSPGEMPMSPVEMRRFDPNPATPASGQPTTTTEALARGMRELWRGPNLGGYALLADVGTNELVLYGFPPASALRNDPGRAGAWPVAMAPEMEVSEGEWDKYATGTSDAAQRALDQRVQRYRTGLRARAQNDANRSHYGQRPIGGGPDRAA